MYIQHTISTAVTVLVHGITSLYDHATVFVNQDILCAAQFDAIENRTQMAILTWPESEPNVTFTCCPYTAQNDPKGKNQIRSLEPSQFKPKRFRTHFETSTARTDPQLMT